MSDTGTKVGQGPDPQSGPLSEELIRTMAEVFRIFANRGRQVLAEKRACRVDQVNAPNAEEGTVRAPLKLSHTSVALTRYSPCEGGR